MAYLDEDGAGVGGWLAAFVVMIGIFTPARIAIDLFGFFRDPLIGFLPPDLKTNVQLLVVGLAVGTVAICWYICWRLFNRQAWRTVPISLLLLWLVCLANLVGGALYASMLLALPLTEAVGVLPLIAYLPVLICIGWTAYFLVSKRVANTYPRHPNDEEVRQTFD